jgi:hypothetical protein
VSREKFLVLRGADLRVQFGVNPWLEHSQILTSLDLAKQEPVKDPARFPWHEVRKIDHYWIEGDALVPPMRMREHPEPYGERA